MTLSGQEELEHNPFRHLIWSDSIEIALTFDNLASNIPRFKFSWRKIFLIHEEILNITYFKCYRMSERNVFYWISFYGSTAAI